MLAKHLKVQDGMIYVVAGIPLSYVISPYPSMLHLFAHDGRECNVPFSPSIPPLFVDQSLSVEGGTNSLAGCSIAEIGDGKVSLFSPEDTSESVLLLIDTLDSDSRKFSGVFTLPKNKESHLLTPYSVTDTAARGLIVLHPGDAFLLRTTRGAERHLCLTKNGAWSIRNLTSLEHQLFQ